MLRCGLISAFTPATRLPQGSTRLVHSQAHQFAACSMTVNEQQPEAIHQSVVPSEKATQDTREARGSAQPLLQPFRLGEFNLSTRMAYAPLTRCRAKGTIPQPAAAEYYCQRAYKGSFQLSEGTVISPHGHGYPDTPGINTQEHVEAWKPIVKAVHEKGGVFFMQLWHVGRVSHATYQPDDQGPVAPSAIAIDQEQTLPDGTKDKFPVPRALRTDEMAGIVDQWVVGARNAIAAGFDGVEVHSAHGYLLEEFLKTSANQRTDQYGGSIENRCRIVLEVVDAVVAEVGPGKVGIRLSPFTKFMDSRTDDPYEVYGHLTEELNKRDLLYVHFVEPRMCAFSDFLPFHLSINLVSLLSDAVLLLFCDCSASPPIAYPHIVSRTCWNDIVNITSIPCMLRSNSYMGGGLAADNDSLSPFREASRHPFLAAGGFDQEIGNKAITDGHADMVVYGRHWIANPDLPERFRLGAPLNKYNRSTFYTSDQVKGYTDYPFLDESLAKELAAKL